MTSRESLMAIEHIAWCVERGMTTNEVCESVNAFLTSPTWPDALSILTRRASQMRRGIHPLPIITNRAVK